MESPLTSNFAGRKFEFVEADGAYWLKMKILPPGTPAPRPGFGRQVAP